MDSSFDLSYMTFIAIQAALQAGHILRKGFGTSCTIIHKPGNQNFVTEYDKASEDCIISLIKHHFPQHSFLAEESGFSAEQDHPIIWMIDPLDGTTNFIHQLPLFTISIAAYYHEEGLCGVIFQPMTHELFITEKGKGAYLNGTRLSVSAANRVDHAIMGTGFPSNASENLSYNKDLLSHLIQLRTTLRNLGSAALTLAYVAAGKLDGFWMDYLYPWDLAAGKLLIEEAGGRITKYDGSSLQMTVPSSVLASNPILHQEILFYQTLKNSK